MMEPPDDLKEDPSPPHSRSLSPSPQVQQEKEQEEAVNNYNKMKPKDLHKLFVETKDLKTKLDILFSYLPKFKGRKYIVPFAFKLVADKDCPQDIAVKSLLKIAPFIFNDSHVTQEDMTQWFVLVHPLLEDETVSLQDKLKLFAFHVDTPSEKALFQLSKFLEPDFQQTIDDNQLTGLLRCLNKSSNPELRKKGEDYLEKNPKARLKTIDDSKELERIFTESKDYQERHEIINLLAKVTVDQGHTDSEEAKESIKERINIGKSLVFRQVTDEPCSLDLKFQALQQFPLDHLDSAQKRQLDPVIIQILEDESFPIEKRVEFVPSLFEMKPSTLFLEKALDYLVIQPHQDDRGVRRFYWNIAERFTLECNQILEEFFFKDPSAFLNSDDLGAMWLDDYLEKVEEAKRFTFIEKLGSVLKGDIKVKDQEKEAAASAVISYSTEPSFLETAEKTLWEALGRPLKEGEELQEYSYNKYSICKFVFEYSQNSQFKERIIARLLEKVQEQEPGEDSLSGSYLNLKLLLKQKNEEARSKTLEIAKVKIESLDPSQLSDLQINTLVALCKDLKKTKQAPDLQQKILTLLTPQFEAMVKWQQKPKKETSSSEGSSSESESSESDEQKVQKDIERTDLGRKRKGLSFEWSDAGTQKDEEDSDDSSDNEKSNHDLKIEVPQSQKDSDSEESGSESYDSEEDKIISLFLSSPNKEQQNQAFGYFKEILINKGRDSDGESDDDRLEEITESIFKTLGEEHPWAQESIQIFASHEAPDSQSSIGVYQELLKKTKDKVIHNPKTMGLADGTTVTFNLETLKEPRQKSNVPLVKHSEFTELASDLVKEIEENPEAKAYFDSLKVGFPPSYLVKAAETRFFNVLLDQDEAKIPAENVSLLSIKLREVILYARTLKGQNQGKQEEKQATNGLTPQSFLILQLLINVQACPTNQENGVDQTHRVVKGSLNNFSEDDMSKERIQQTSRLVMMEDLRLMRENVLDGDGPISMSLIFPEGKPKGELIPEPPHQGKYLQNLLGGVTGIFLKGGKVSYDLDGWTVHENLRSLSRQHALDALYQHFTPEKVVKYYQDRFNTRDFKIGPSGQDRSGGLINSLFTVEEQRDPKHYDDEDSFWTPLLVTKVLLKLGIFEEVKPSKSEAEAEAAELLQ